MDLKSDESIWSFQKVVLPHWHFAKEEIESPGITELQKGGPGFEPNLSAPIERITEEWGDLYKRQGCWNH